MAKTMTTVCNDLEISETYEAKCSYKSFWSLLFSSITTDKRMLHPFPFPYIHLILFVCGKTTFYVKINMSAVIFLFFSISFVHHCMGKKPPKAWAAFVLEEQRPYASLVLRDKRTHFMPNPTRWHKL